MIYTQLDQSASTSRNKTLKAHMRLEIEKRFSVAKGLNKLKLQELRAKHKALKSELATWQNGVSKSQH